MATLDFDASLAVVIGINQYGNGIAPLRTAVADATAISKILEDNHGYQVISLLNEQAQLTALNTFIHQKLPILLDANSRLLIYFAGHGIAQDGDDGPAGYLIPQDAMPGAIDSYLPMTALHDALTELPCRHFLAIFDCCFAGAFRWSSTRDINFVPEVIHRERYDRYRQDPAWQVITSAAYDQKAIDVMTLRDDRGEASGESGYKVSGEINQRHSPFAEALMQGLQGMADTSPPAQNGRPAGDGVITATELYLYLRDSVEVLTDGQRKRQTPEICSLRNHNKGEYIFLTPGHELNLPPAPELNKENNPYRGLESFDQDHHDLFFGREREIEQLLARLDSPHPLTVVLGVSGTGKSSLVKAGLLPRLTKRSDFHALPVMRPGTQPLESLARTCAELVADDEAKGLAGRFLANEEALVEIVEQWRQAHPNGKLLLVIDQAEELMTQTLSPEKAFRFQQLIKRVMAKHWECLWVIATLRLDFEAQFQDEALREEWMDARFVLAPMGQAQLRDAIEKPAAARVLYFEPPSLVDKLVDDVAQTPGALPLLSFTLSELYFRYLDRRSDNRALTEADYRALGGVTGSLTRRATQEYDALVAADEAYAKTIKHVMLRMVAVEGGELARRRVPLSELVYADAAENERVQTLLETLIAARLVVRGQEGEGEQLFAEPYAEPAHDALVRGWDKLLHWKNAEQVNLGLQRELTPQSRNWQAERAAGRKGRAKGFLWHGNPRLGLLKEVLKSDDSWLNALEATFVRQSLKRKRNRLGQGIAVTAMTIAALSGLSIFAFNRAADAEKNAHEAERQEQLAQKEAKRAEDEALRAKEQADLAKKNEEKAEAEEENAKNEANRANEQTKLAEEQRDLAEQRQKETEVARRAEAEQTKLAEQKQQEAQESEAAAVESAKEARRKTTLAELREQAARVLNLIPTNNAVSGLILAIDTMERSQSLPSVAPVAQSTLLHAVQVSQEVNRLTAPELREVTAMVYSPDGQYIVTGSANGTLRMRDGQTGKPLGETLTGHKNKVTTVAYSSDSQRIVSGSTDGTLRLWDGQTGKPLGEPLTGHKEMVTTVAYSPDSQRIVSGSTDKTLRLWDGQTGKPLSDEPFPDNGDVMDYFDYFTTVAYSPDGQRIVSGSRFGTLQMWDGQTGEPLEQSQSLGNNRITTVAYSPDSQRIVSVSHDETLQMWDGQTGEPLGDSFSGRGLYGVDLPGSKVRASKVAYSPDNQHIVSNSGDGMLWIWNAHTRKQLGQPLAGHSSGEIEVVYSPNGQRIVSSSRGDGTLRVWDAQPREQLGRSFSKLESGLSTSKYRFPKDPFGLFGLITMVYSPDGQRIVSSYSDGKLQIWNAQTGELLSEKSFSKVLSVAYSPNSQRFVSGGHQDGKLRIWDAQTGELLGEPLAHNGGYAEQRGAYTAVAYSPDGKHIVSGSNDGTLQIWDSNTHEPLGEPLGFAGSDRPEITTVAYSLDGQRIVSGSGDGMLRIWDSNTRKLLGETSTGHRFVTTVAYSPPDSPYGQHIVTGGKDGMLRIWDGQTGEPSGQPPLTGHRGEITTVTYSPDGQYIVSGSQDETLRLWDAQTGDLLGQPLIGHSSPIAMVAYSPDGQHIVSGSLDRTLWMWDISPDALLNVACKRLQHHPQLIQPETFTIDSAFLEVTYRAQSACQQRNWGHTP